MTFSKIFLRLVLIGYIICVPPAAKALTYLPTEYVCPIDGEKFRTTMAVSGTRLGQYLDLRPYGSIASPWPLAKCPTSGFVIYKEEYSQVELSRLREYVASEDYKLRTNTDTNYYLSAKLRANLGESPAQLAFVFLQATWEARSIVQYEKYALDALDAYKAAIAEATVGSNQWLTNQFVAGELERRLARPEDAKRRFLRLAEREEVKEGVYRKILDLQLKLLSVGHNGPELIPKD
jgi:Uncharacterized protein conserved in bacteria (DUF2225)